MDALHIDRLQTRIRAADDAGARHAAAVQHELVDHALEAALAPHAPDEEVVLVKRLHTTLRLRGRRSERAAAQDWSAAIALELQRLLRSSAEAEVLRFRHLGAARLAFARDAVAGQAQRDWAWQRLGWLARAQASASERRSALLQLMSQDAATLLPLLRGLVVSPLWPQCLVLLDEDMLPRVTQALLQAAGGTAPFDDTQRRAPLATDAAAPGAVDLPPLAPTTAAALHQLAQAAPARQRWQARLTLLASQPWLARCGGPAVDRLLDRWLPQRPAAAAAAETQRDEARTATAPPAAAAPHGDGARVTGNTTRDDTRAPDSQDATAANDAPANRPPHADPELRPAAPAADTGWTEHAGLLLLLPVLEPSGALALLLDEQVWPAATWPLALHRFATSLLPLAADDAAALAFCGRRPGEAPVHPYAHVNAAQRQALAQATALLQTALVQRLPTWRAPGLVERIARRRGRIVADPGWTEVRFSLRDVSLDLRRAALDLDPGLLPWLGLVLRYVYE